MAMTIVLPLPVAILLHSRRKGPPSPGTVTPVRSAAGASASQMSVSMASNWQKKRRNWRCSGSCQWASRRRVMPVAPG